MGAIGRLFGLGIFIAGIVIAVYWTLWMAMTLPYIANKYPRLQGLFLEPVWIFRLPAMALIGGISFITYFIISTNQKIALARAKAAAAAQKKVA